jgi:hypothetical protein
MRRHGGPTRTSRAKKGRISSAPTILGGGSRGRFARSGLVRATAASQSRAVQISASLGQLEGQLHTVAVGVPGEGNVIDSCQAVEARRAGPGIALQVQF